MYLFKCVVLKFLGGTALSMLTLKGTGNQSEAQKLPEDAVQFFKSIGIK